MTVQLIWGGTADQKDMSEHMLISMLLCGRCGLHARSPHCAVVRKGGGCKTKHEEREVGIHSAQLENNIIC